MTTIIPAALGPRQLAGEVRKHAAEPREWMSRIRLSPDERWYERLHADDQYEVWLISWLPGQGTGFHDHGGSAGAFTVVWGTLEEHQAGTKARAAEGLHPVTATPVSAGRACLRCGVHSRRAQHVGSGRGQRARLLAAAERDDALRPHRHRPDRAGHRSRGPVVSHPAAGAAVIGAAPTGTTESGRGRPGCPAARGPDDRRDARGRTSAPAPADTGRGFRGVLPRRPPRRHPPAGPARPRRRHPGGRDRGAQRPRVAFRPRQRRPPAVGRRIRSAGHRVLLRGVHLKPGRRRAAGAGPGERHRHRRGFAAWAADGLPVCPPESAGPGGAAGRAC